MNHDNYVSYIFRSGADPANLEVETDDDETVELEKSNVLLMGPTGSGTLFLVQHYFHVTKTI